MIGRRLLGVILAIFAIYLFIDGLAYGSWGLNAASILTFVLFFITPLVIAIWLFNYDTKAGIENRKRIKENKLKSTNEPKDIFKTGDREWECRY